MPGYCVVPSCTRSVRRNHPAAPPMGFFTFPVKDPDRCRRWVKAINNPKLNDNTPPAVLQKRRVCSRHFKPEEIERGLMRCMIMGEPPPRTKLSDTAVPSTNLDEDEPPPAKRWSLTEASLPEVDSMNRTGVSSTSVEAEVNVVHSATNDASPHVPRTFTAAHETYEANILSLFKRCQICGCAINSTEVRYVRGKMRVKWDCFGGHAGTWKSLLRVKAMFKVDNPEDSLDEEENMMVSEDGSDSNWDPLENNTDSMFTDSDSDSMFTDSDSGTDEIDAEDDAVGLKLRQLCPDCGKLINIQKAHTCEHKLKPYPCNVCGKRFVSEHHLKVHGRVHKENYKHVCKFCLKTFKTRAHKLAHEQSHPRVKKPYQCPDCPEVFAKIQVRRDHLRNHRGPQQFICHICNMEFAYSNALERHVVTHTGEKQFVCEVCQFSFSQAGHLKSHMRVHTGEKPYQCQHCDKSFNHNVSLKSHIKHYHGKVPDPGMMEKTTRNQSEPEAEKNKMNEMENNTVDVRETHGATLMRGRKKRLCATINRKKKRLTGRPKGRPQINKMIASDATDKLKRKLCDSDESWSNSDSVSDSADE